LAAFCLYLKERGRIMKRQRSSWLAILAIAAVMLMLPACQAPPAATNPPPTPTPTPTPVALPDPKTDPQGALNYATENDLVQSMGFTMSMSMTLQPADEDATGALGGVVAAALQAAAMTGSGSGLVEVTDSSAGLANMQMAMDISAAGQQMTVETIVLGDEAWTRVGNGEWTKTDVASAQSSVPGIELPGMKLPGVKGMFEDVVDVVYVGEEMRDGQSLHHLRFTLDPASVDMGAILGTTGSSEDDISPLMQDAFITADVWLGVDDLIARYQNLRMDFILPGLALGVGDASLHMVMNTSMVFTDINEPVTIEAPVTP
jgi:hypothetical protein